MQRIDTVQSPRAEAEREIVGGPYDFGPVRVDVSSLAPGIA
jgi:hypothetical protein